MNDANLTLANAILQIEGCSFECDAGPLANNVGFRSLKTLAKNGPIFIPGQWVWFEIAAEAAGIKLSRWANFCIVGCRMSSDSKLRTWEYDLSRDPPEAYHAGIIHFHNVAESKLRIAEPEAQQA